MINEEFSDVLFTNEWDGPKLRSTRESLGLTQQDVADILGLSKMSISYYEQGYRLNKCILLAYGTVLERYYAWKKGYVPAFREVGTSMYHDPKILMESRASPPT